MRGMAWPLRPLCVSGEAAPCGQGRSEEANEGRMNLNIAVEIHPNLYKLRRVRYPILKGKSKNRKSKNRKWLVGSG